MIEDTNGVVYGNWNKESEIWQALAPHVKSFSFTGKGMSASIVTMGAEATGKNAKLNQPHSHSNEQMTICLEGKGTVIIDGIKYPIKKGSYWLAPPNVPHTLDTSDADGPVTILQLFAPSRPADAIKKIIKQSNP
jgi:quercetin dioxygenase-like cupin family protein